MKKGSYPYSVQDEGQDTSDQLSDFEWFMVSETGDPVVVEVEHGGKLNDTKTLKRYRFVHTETNTIRYRYTYIPMTADKIQSLIDTWWGDMA